MKTLMPNKSVLIDRRQCMAGVSAAALMGLVPNYVSAAADPVAHAAPSLGNVLSFPAPSDAALFLQRYLSSEGQ